MIRAALTAAFFALGPAVSIADPIMLPAPDAVFLTFSPDQIALGQLLFYDPILSGSQNVSCATCHHPKFATSDGLALGLGDGATGLGPDRKVDPGNVPEQRIPRNAPALFNLGATEFQTFFYDGRLQADPEKPGGIRTPLGDDMTQGFASVLSAQSMFPALSPDEMAGHYSENVVSRAVRLGLLTGPGGAWDIIAEKVSNTPGYRARFNAILGAPAAISFTDISDAIAAFIATEWRADDSPFDQFLRQGIQLTPNAARGMAMFYGDAGCSDCHAGQFQTDHDFHAIAMPQTGPGKAARFEDHARDTGRMRVTGDPADAYAFRTPSLRNVVLTAPYGHSGAYSDLRAVITHHMDPVAQLRAYVLDRKALPSLPGAIDDWVLTRPDEIEAIAGANILPKQSMSKDQIDDILAFLNALTDEASITGKLGVPLRVPSGLSVDQ